MRMEFTIDGSGRIFARDKTITGESKGLTMPAKQNSNLRWLRSSQDADSQGSLSPLSTDFSASAGGTAALEDAASSTVSNVSINPMSKDKTELVKELSLRAWEEGRAMKHAASAPVIRR